MLFFFLYTHLYIYNVYYIERPRDLGLNSDYNLNFNAGFVFVKINPNFKVVNIGISYNDWCLMEDFLKASKDLWGFDLSQIIIKDDCNFAIHYDDDFLNNYLMWYIDDGVFEKITIWEGIKKIFINHKYIICEH